MLTTMSGLGFGTIPVVMAAVLGSPDTPPSPARTPVETVAPDRQRPPRTMREERAADGTIILSIVTLAGVGATVFGAVLLGRAPSRSACAGPGAPESGACNERWIGRLSLAVGIPVTLAAATGTGLLGHRWRSLRNERLKVSATGFYLRF